MKTDQSIKAIAEAKYKLIILPVGSCEQHGPYLPIDTDLRIANLLAEKLSESFADSETLLLPPIPFSSSWEHTGLGTISLSANTISSIIHDIAYSLKTWIKPCLLVLINWHGGNSLLSSLASEITAKENIPTIVINAISEAGDIWTSRHKNIFFEDIHAGAIETSIIEAFWPHLVNFNIPENTDYHLGIDPSLIQPIMQAFNTRELTKNGIWGFPHLSTATDGNLIISQLVHSIQDRVQKITQLREIYCSEEETK